MNTGHDLAEAFPTKQFFVSMLTRDIKLEDAILDLLDNCLDGALRVAKDGQVNYSAHRVSIAISATDFEIEDNCGGIPREVARKYAFKMGRDPDDKRDSDNETIGMYGVGMKRAIFKMGRTAVVKTLHDDDAAAYEVSISPSWLNDKEWKPLPIVDLPPAALPEPGTTISVSDLYPGVARHFTNDSFINDLRNSIAEHFTMFLQQGLEVKVNGKIIEPLRVEVLVSEEDDGPAPYVYETNIGDVRVSITVGLNTARSLSDEDDDAHEFEGDRSAATAGWTVFCNDRAVIFGDKSRLTGWGDKMPLYHYQYSIISGIVEFRSNNAEHLPVTTTKRALDASSDVWLQALVKMKDGMRLWISYTNMWKNHPRSDQAPYWSTAKSLPIREAIKVVGRRPSARRASGEIEFNPVKRKVLPSPEKRVPSTRRIVFSRPVEEIRLVSQSLFEREDELPGVVGDKCFEIVLIQCKNGGPE